LQKLREFLQNWQISFARNSILVENYTVTKSATSASRQTLAASFRTMELNRKFIGKINAVKRYDDITVIIVIEIFVFFFLYESNATLSIISLIITFSLIIWVLLRKDLQDEILIFDEKNILHKQKEKITEYSYLDVLKNEFINQQKNQSFVRIIFKEGKFNYILDTESGLDFKIEDFAEFLLSKNNSIEFIMKQTNFETYKYYKNGNEIRRILKN
jgi:hypothetical protein